MSKHKILDEVSRERAFQDQEHGGPAHDDTLQENGWLAILIRHMGLAASDRAEVDPDRYRRQMIRVAAIAVAAVESFDRTRGKAQEEKVAGARPLFNEH